MPLQEQQNPAPYPKVNRHTDPSTSCGPCMAHELALAPVGHKPGVPIEYWLEQWATYFMEAQEFSGEAPVYHQRKKKNPRLDTLERRGIVWLYPHQIFPKVPQLSLREHFLACDLSHRGKGGYVSEHLASSAMWDTILEAHFSLVSSSILNHELHGWEQWAARTAAGSRKHPRDMNDSNHITDSILEAYLWVTGISCPQISPTSTATPSTSQTHTQKHKYTHLMASSLCMLPIAVKTHFSR